MKPLIAIAVIAGAVSSLHGQAPLYLQDHHGVAHGPYVFVTGETVRVGSVCASVVQPSLKLLAFQDKVAHTVIPEITFTNASILHVTAVLQRMSGEYVPIHMPIAQGEVRIDLDIEDYDAVPDDDPFAPKPERTTPPPITFSARYIDLIDAIAIICEVAGLDYRIGEDVVTIYPKHRRQVQPTP